MKIYIKVEICRIYMKVGIILFWQSDNVRIIIKKKEIYKLIIKNIKNTIFYIFNKIIKKLNNKINNKINSKDK